MVPNTLRTLPDVWWPPLSERLSHVNLNNVKVQEAEMELAAEALADPGHQGPWGRVFLGGEFPGSACWFRLAWRGGLEVRSTSALPTRALSWPWSLTS